MIMQETKDAYSEIYNLLKIMKKQEVMRIPIEVLENIKENQNKEYTPKVLGEDSKIILSKKAMCIYLYLYTTYIEKNDKTKQEILNILKENENYNEIDFFVKNNKKEKVNDACMVVYKESFFKSIINKIKNFFCKGK